MLVRAQLPLGEGDLTGLEEARPIDVGLFEVRAAKGRERLGAVLELAVRMLREAAGVNEIARSEEGTLGGGKEGVNLALGDVLLAPKELALNSGKGRLSIIS